MDEDTVYTRTFRRAIENAGGIERLASALGASVLEIKGWAAGTSAPPPGAFLLAIDIVAGARTFPGVRGKS
jgi:hypothetical protein